MIKILCLSCCFISKCLNRRIIPNVLNGDKKIVTLYSVEYRWITSVSQILILQDPIHPLISLEDTNYVDIMTNCEKAFFFFSWTYAVV